MGDLGTLSANLGVDTSGLNLALDAVKAFSSAALSPLGAVTAGVAAVGFAMVKAVDAAKELQKSMANVSTMVDTSKINMDDLTESVQQMTTETGKSSEDLSAGLYQVFSAGIADADDALKVLKISAKAATAGLSDTNISVDAITTILNAYGLGVDNAQRVSDLLFQTVKEGKTTYGELAGSVGKVISTASALDISLEDLFATVATLTKGGIDTSEAMTSLNSIMKSIIKPGKDAGAVSRELGIEWSTVALKSKGLAGFMADITEKAGGNIEALNALVPNVRGLKGILALTGKQAGEFVKIQESMQTATGATNEAFKKQTATLDFELKRFDLIWERFKQTVGGFFIGPLTTFLKGFNNLLESIGSFFTAVPTTDDLINMSAEQLEVFQRTRKPKGGNSITTSSSDNRQFTVNFNGSSKNDFNDEQRMLRFFKNASQFAIP